MTYDDYSYLDIHTYLFDKNTEVVVYEKNWCFD
jgi:hypothetical protein